MTSARRLIISVLLILTGCAGADLSQRPVTRDRQLQVPPAVSPAERMTRYPSPGEYVAFSLRVAERKVKESSESYRIRFPEVFNLGGITQIEGLVWDRQGNDLILVGRYQPTRQPLTLDDLIVALRARFIHGKWPVVSIDPTPETERTLMQHVRFEGGIEGTQFGADLFDADYRLKRIGMGFVSAGVPAFQSYWDLSLDRAKASPAQSWKIGSRFWFYPVLPSVAVREDVVSVKGLTVGVFTEVLSAELDGRKVEDLTTFQDASADQFARTMSERFETLAELHPSFSRVQGLDELVALSKALEELEQRPDLGFWLTDYRVKPVQTPKEVEVLKREEPYRLPVAGGWGERILSVSGGVQLMAIATRLKAGDVTALKQAVLKTRPSPDAVSWRFVVGDWLIPTTPGMLTPEAVAPLFAHAVFLQQRRRYDDAITLYGKILELKPDLAEAYNDRGLAYADKGQYDQAIADFTKALEINPNLAAAYNNRGLAYADKGQYDQAIQDYNKGLRINQNAAVLYENRGSAYSRKGMFDLAVEDLRHAIKMDPHYSEAFSDLATLFVGKRMYEEALRNANEALRINPRLAEAYNTLGMIYAEHKRDYSRAIDYYNKALDVNPELDAAYLNRGNSYASRGDYQLAIQDYNKAIQLNPQLSEPYNSRGWLHTLRKAYDLAEKDFFSALNIDPSHVGALNNLGLLYDDMNSYKRAIEYLTKAISIDPNRADIYWNRGNVYARQKEYRKARLDWEKASLLEPNGTAGNRAREKLSLLKPYEDSIGQINPTISNSNELSLSDDNRAIELEPMSFLAYLNRGKILLNKYEFDKAIADLSEAIKINPQCFPCYINKALACEKASRYDEALYTYKELLKYTPHNENDVIDFATIRIEKLESR